MDGNDLAASAALESIEHGAAEAEGPPLPPHMLHDDQDEAADDKKRADPPEVITDDDDPPVPPHMEDSDSLVGKKRDIKSKKSGSGVQGGGAPSTTSPQTATNNHTAQQQNIGHEGGGHSSETNTAGETFPPGVPPSSMISSIQPPSPSMLHPSSSTNEPPPAAGDGDIAIPLYFPVEATLVRESQLQQEEELPHHHSQQTPAPLIHGVLVTNIEDGSRGRWMIRHRVKIGCGLLLIIGVIAAAAAAGAVIANDKSDGGNGDALGKEDVQLPAATSRPTDPQTFSKSPSAFPTVGDTISPTASINSTTLLGNGSTEDNINHIPTEKPTTAEPIINEKIFEEPKSGNGKRLDCNDHNCSSNPLNVDYCSALVARHYCQQKGYGCASDFVVERDVGVSTQDINGNTCFPIPFLTECCSFFYVSCSNLC